MGKLLIGKVTHPLKDNLETTEPGQGSLDARQGNALRDMIDSLGLNVGDLTALQTTDKDSLVNAINNLADAVSTLNSKMNQFKTENITTAETSIGTGASARASIKTVVSPPNGYKILLAYPGWSSTKKILAVGCTVDANTNTVTVLVENISDLAISATYTLHVLYIME